MRVFIYFLFLMLLTSSCSSNESDTDNEEIDEFEFIYGTYKLTELRSNDPSNLNGYTTESYNVVDELSCFEVIKTLNPDRTVTGTETKLDLSKNVSDEWTIECGILENINRNWRITENNNTILVDGMMIIGNQLVIERDSELELFDRVVYTKQ